MFNFLWFLDQQKIELHFKLIYYDNHKTRLQFLNVK